MDRDYPENLELLELLTSCFLLITGACHLKALEIRLAQDRRVHQI
jgi:hypothetical protein